ncbi:MAG TPA: matrixin family metalloprotease [Pyrinomonadaceae bacterium]|nr:matrixin family metalloprotease [Pyrinomonadaceae bacterium]
MRSIIRYFAAFLVFAAATSSFASEYEAGAGAKAAPARWRSDRITIAISRSLFAGASNFKPGTDIERAIRNAISNWESVANVQISFVESKRRDASPATRGDGESLVTIAQTSENLALFTSGDTNISAKTRVFTDRNGFVTEADIVLNPFAAFSSDGSYATYDLEGVLTHEIGHLLGLRHSQIMGSVMHGNVDINSTIGPGFSFRKALSAEDIAVVRSLYGPAALNGSCCGRVTGRLLDSDRSLTGSLILLEDKNGEISAGTRIQNDGDFSFGGLSAGTYAVLIAREGVGTLAEDLGTLYVESGVVTRFEAKPSALLAPFELAYVGVDGLLSTSAVKLRPGSTNLMTVGGRGLDASQLALYTSSPFVRIDEATLADLDYAENVSAIRFQITVDEKAPAGAYSIFAQLPTGEFAVLPGAISVAR